MWFPYPTVLTAARRRRKGWRMSFDVLVTAPQLETAGRRLLEEAGCRLDFIRAVGDRADMERLLATRRYDGLVSRSIPLSAAAIASCPTLRVISRAARETGGPLSPRLRSGSM